MEHKLKYDPPNGINEESNYSDTYTWNQRALVSEELTSSVESMLIEVQDKMNR